MPSRPAVLALLITFATVVLRLTPPVRRRVLLLAAPAATAAATAAFIATQTFGGPTLSANFSPPLHHDAPIWIGLVATPVLTVSIGAWTLARYEHKLSSGALLA
jgi:hypothetical protein